MNATVWPVLLDIAYMLCPGYMTKSSDPLFGIVCPALTATVEPPTKIVSVLSRLLTCNCPGFTPLCVMSVAAVPTAIDPFVIGMIVTSEHQ